jgi:hypothetical protein
LYDFLLKKLKARLMGTAEYHKERSISSSESDQTDDEQEYKTPVEMHRKLARYLLVKVTPVC